MAEARMQKEDGVQDVLSEGTRIWAAWGITSYYRGVVDKISKRTINVWFDDDCKKKYGRDQEGKIVIDREPRENELQESAMVIITMPKKKAMYLGELTTKRRRSGVLYGVRLLKWDDSRQEEVYRKPKNIRMLSEYVIKGSSSTKDDSFYSELSQSLQRVILDQTDRPDETKVLSPEKLWQNKDLISFDSPKHGSEMFPSLDYRHSPVIDKTLVKENSTLSQFDPLWQLSGFLPCSLTFHDSTDCALSPGQENAPVKHALLDVLASTPASCSGVHVASPYTNQISPVLFSSPSCLADDSGLLPLWSVKGFPSFFPPSYCSFQDGKYLISPVAQDNTYGMVEDDSDDMVKDDILMTWPA